MIAINMFKAAEFSVKNGGTGANFKGNGRTDVNPSINFGPGPGPTRKCFKCGSPNHLRSTCPNLSGRPGTMLTARSSHQPTNIKHVSMSREDHVQVGENISDDLHTDRPMMTSAVTPANNDVMPIVQRVQRNIIDDRAIVMYAVWHIRPHSPLAGPSLSLTRRSPHLLRDCPGLLTCRAAGRVVPV